MKPLGQGDPQTLGQYRLLRALGSGGMGRVFLGRSAQGRMVAVKLIHPQFAAEPEFRRRFEREVAAAVRVGGQWTAPVLDADTTGEIPWVATGYVAGPPLQRVVDELYGALPESTLWRLADGLAQALTAIHGSGLVHRDLKPSNVMVTVDGPKVIDFGIARAADASVVTRTGAVIGSPGFMSPEQVRGERLDASSDIFSFGAVLAFAANGSGPFDTEDSAVHAMMYRVVAEPPELGRLAGPLRELVASCLAKEAGDRPALADIARLAVGHGGSGPWLPPELTDRLARDAAALLDLEGPEATQLAQPAPAAPAVPAAPVPAVPTMTAATTPQPGYATPPPPPGYHTPPPGYHTPPPTGYVTQPQGPVGPPSRGRGRSLVIAAVAGALVAGIALVSAVSLLGGDSDSGDTGDTANGGESSQPAQPTQDDGQATDDEPTAGDQPSTEEETPAEEAKEPGEEGYFEGDWAGTYTQDDIVIETVEVDYTGGEVGETVASVRYPSLECTATWRLEQESAEVIVVYEQATSGDCINTEITLTAIDAFTMSYFFESDYFASGDGEGELKRQ
ncbi:serine/threonine-protein kinase [Streptomyces sp. 6N223]|uniref:serine/threonine-protein kinase n=1 Tax=Streptomyces sp. 6N223 TaxID=3457412 RepID=UPI003FD2EEEA